MHHLFQELSNDLWFSAWLEICDGLCHPRLIWGRSFFPGCFFLCYSSYYWVTNFYHGSFRQFFIISDLIFIIAVVYNIICEYAVPLFPFCFALLIIDCGTHCDNISNIITALISVFQVCTVMLYCDDVSYSGGIVALFRVLFDFPIAF